MTINRESYQKRDKEVIRDYYVHRRDTLKEEAGRLRRRSRAYVISELAAFIVAIACLAVFTVAGNGWWIAVSVLMLVTYVVVRQMDVTICERIDFLDDLAAVYKRELDYQEGDFSPFDDGRRYTDPHHPFSYDLDLFGPGSLYQRICRTVTTGGADRLATLLSAPRMAEGDSESDAAAMIECRRQCVDRLAELESLRSRFIALGHGKGIDTDKVKSTVARVETLPMPSWPASWWACTAAALSIAVFLSLIAASVFTDMPSSIPLLWAFAHLLAMAVLCSRRLVMVRRGVSTLRKQLKQAVKLVGFMADSELYDLTVSLSSEAKRHDDAAHDTEAGEPIHPLSSAAEVKKAFGELYAILEGLDRSGSFLGQLVFNTFALTDFFILRRFVRWQHKGLGNIGQWMDCLAEMDAMVSMGTLRYNEPLATTAEIVADGGVVFKAQGMWHPFVGDEAVRNDFDIHNDNFYIVTGANMAGKSTFLRSIGVNYVLATCGMPVFAEHLQVSLFSLFTSMRTSDDLGHGISYFNAELLRLGQLVDSVKTARHTLIILDEILKGTNSLDKLNGSRMFLETISRLPVTGVIATHDLELSKMSEEYPGQFHNYCFEIGLSDRITYSYRITPGVARNQNATYLLKGILERI